VAAPGRRRVARRPDRGVRGGGGHVVAPRALRHRPRGLGHPHLGRRDGEPDGDDRRSGRAPRVPARHCRDAAAGAALEGVRAYASDQAHFSIRRALDVLGFPAGTLRVLPSDDASALRAEPVGGGDRGRSGPPGSRRSRSRAVAGTTTTPAPSTTCRRSPSSPSSNASGCTSTRRTAAPPGCPRERPRRCPASSSPTP